MSDFEDRSTEELKQQLLELHRELARRAGGEDSDLSSMELSLESESLELRHLALQERLDAHPKEDGRPKRCPKCGKSVRVKSRFRERTLETLSGRVRYARDYYYCAHCSLGFYPRDEVLGVPANGSVSRELEKRLLDFGINDSYEHAAERWNFHYSNEVSSNLMRRVVDRVGELMDSCHEAAIHHETKTVCCDPPELLVVQNDGGMVPLRGDEPWKEAKLAAIFRAEHHNPRNGKKRGTISQTRYVGVLGDQKEFRASLDIALRMERGLKAKTAIWVADGAPGNWRLADTLLPKAVQILDWCHAVEAAMVCGRQLLGETSPFLELWKETVERHLMAGELEVLLEELEALRFLASKSQRKPIKDLQRYYRNNAERMDYPRYLAQGWLIGSGIVESAHRHVIQRRMKNAGQHWSISRGKTMVRLRAAYQTAGCTWFHQALYRARKLTKAGKIPTFGPIKRRASNR
ncbi:MAG: ISKra4 family transposase [Myxococcota bacterium]